MRKRDLITELANRLSYKVRDRLLDTLREDDDFMRDILDGLEAIMSSNDFLNDIVEAYTDSYEYRALTDRVVEHISEDPELFEGVKDSVVEDIADSYEIVRNIFE